MLLSLAVGRAVVCSHDKTKKKKDSYTERKRERGNWEGNTCCFDGFKYVCTGDGDVPIRALNVSMKVASFLEMGKKVSDAGSGFVLVFSQRFLC